jgi:hypothetical protein
MVGKSTSVSAVSIDEPMSQGAAGVRDMMYCNVCQEKWRMITMKQMKEIKSL